MTGRIPDQVRGQICPLCGTGLPIHYQAPQAGGWHVIECPREGTYEISAALEDALAGGQRSEFALHIPYLCAEVRQEADRGGRARLTLENYQEIARIRGATSIETKLRRILEIIAERSRPGEWITLDPGLLAMRIDATTEVSFLLEYLDRAGRIERQIPPVTRGGPSGTATKRELQYRLTVDGLRDVAPLRPEGLQGVAFVAMWFDPSRSEAFEAIRGALEIDCGLRAIRIDRVHHNDQITDRIMAGIRGAEFLVADVTGQRAGVYFEAGFAMGLGRPVVWCCERADLPNVHFDTRQFSHVIYDSPEQLRPQLRDRVRATILSPMKFD
jgi:hypothetical protein